jgi:beta-1,4-mannosyltransferase
MSIIGAMTSCNNTQAKKSLPGANSDVWFRIASFPDRTLGNPHLQFFYAGMAVHGVRLAMRLTCTPRWIRAHTSSIDAIHLHWPEKIWRGKTRGRLHSLWRVITLARLRALIDFAMGLRTAGRLGIKRLWTVHNIEPHEGADWLDRVGYRIAAKRSDLIICYSDAAAVDVRNRFSPPCEVIAIAHGNYSGAYPPPRDRTTVMREFGLDPSRPVVCCVGLIRRYKGLTVACDAVRALGGSVQLAICGAPHSDADEAEVRASMAGVTGVLVARPLTDQEFSDIIAAGEAVLLPYRKITGSGSLLAAWTLGRGVVASDLPLFREMLACEPEAGDRFVPDDSRSLADAIGRYLATPGSVRAAAALRAADRYSWDKTVEPLVDVLKQWKGRDHVLNSRRQARKTS